MPLSSVWSRADNRLLKYWLEKASSILVIDPNNNPFSFGILRYLETSKSLIYAIQSLSVAHEAFFSPSALPRHSFEDRGSALLHIQRELQQTNPPSHGSLLSAILLGLGSAWVYHETDDNFGMKHLHGARAILDILLAEPGSENDSFLRLAVAAYLGWDQATAFLLHPRDQIPLYSPELYRCIQVMRSEYNATVGYAIELMYLLGNVGRYCRTIIDTGLRNIELEANLEEQLLTYEPTGEDRNSHLVNHAFQKHGLIMLYRAIELAPATLLFDDIMLDYYSKDQIVSQYANDILEYIYSIPENNCYHSILSQPLFTAGLELTKDDAANREKVRERFRKQFSLTRLPDNLRAIELLDEIWNLRDSGYSISWVTFSLQKAGTLMLC